MCKTTATVMSLSINIRLVHANARLTVNQQAAAGILDTSTNQP